jgi:hypothetical protein
MLGSYRLASQQVASRVVLIFIETVGLVGSGRDPFEVLSLHVLVETKEYHEGPVRIVCVRAEFRTEDLHNPNFKQHRYTDLFGAVSRRFPTAAAEVRARIRSHEICGGQCGTGVGFL